MLYLLLKMFACVLRGEGFEPALSGQDFELSFGLTIGFNFSLYYLVFRVGFVLPKSFS